MKSLHAHGYNTLAYKRWREQKWVAKKRGISFLFTFEEWIKWWEDNLGPDWLDKRGCGKGLYVMSRKRDKGAYRLGNVECKLHEQNNRDQKSNGTLNTPPKFGEQNGNSRFTESQIREIYHASGSLRAIARKFDTDHGQIKRIKNGTAWAHLLLKQSSG